MLEAFILRADMKENAVVLFLKSHTRVRHTVDSRRATFLRLVYTRRCAAFSSIQHIAYGIARLDVIKVAPKSVKVFQAL